MNNELVPICRCLKCGAIMVDENPDINAKQYPITNALERMVWIKEKDNNEHYWACPNCRTDEYLIDL